MQLENSDNAVRGRVRPRRVLGLWVALVLAAVTLAGGLSLFAVSLEPNTDYILDEPWVIVFSEGRIGIEFITYGARYSAVLSGIVDGSGNWVQWPVAVTPWYGYSTSPVGARAIRDDADRVHIAWTLYDSDRQDQTFHYVQLDRSGRVVATAGPLGSAHITPGGYQSPVRPAIRVAGGEVHVVWLTNGTYVATVLDLEGRVIAPPSPASNLDNASFGTREPVPDGGDFDSAASVGVGEFGNTYYLWRRSIFGMSGRQPISEYEVLLRRDGPSGSYVKILYSTRDTWWTTRPTVVPAVVLSVAGGTSAPFLMWRLIRLRLRTRC